MKTLWDVFNVIWAIELTSIWLFIGLCVIWGMLIKWGIYLYRKGKRMLLAYRKYQNIYNSIELQDEWDKKVIKDEIKVTKNKKWRIWPKASDELIKETAELIEELRDVYWNYPLLWEALWWIKQDMLYKYSIQKISSKKHVLFMNKKLKDLKAWKDIEKYTRRKCRKQYALPSEIEQLSKDIKFLMEQWKTQTEIWLRAWVTQWMISLAYNKKLLEKELIKEVSTKLQPLLKILWN